MTIGTITIGEQTGYNPNLPLFADKLEFAGDGEYPDDGTTGIEASVASALGKSGINLIACIKCGGSPTYRPEIVMTPGSLSDTTTYPCDDQDGLTFKFKVDGGSEQTVTISGATTTATAIASAINSGLTGASSFVVDSQVYVRSDSHGPNSSIEYTGGTNGCTFATGVNSGTTAKKLRMLKTADGADAQSGAGTTDLSGHKVEAVFLYQ